jgi:predicted ATP-dependent protease
MNNKMSKEDFLKKIADDKAKKDTVQILGANGQTISEVKKEIKEPLDLSECHKLKKEGLNMKAKPAEEKKKGSSIAKVKNMKAKKKETYRDEVYSYLEPFLTETEGSKVQKIKEGLAFQNSEGKWIVVRVVEKKEKPDGATEE